EAEDTDGPGTPDTVLLGAAELSDCAAEDAPLPAYLSARDGVHAEGESPSATARLELLDAFVTQLEEGLSGTKHKAEVDDSAILQSREKLQTLLVSVGWSETRIELTESQGLKRRTVRDEDGAHDITTYADRVTAEL